MTALQNQNLLYKDYKKLKGKYEEEKSTWSKEKEKLLDIIACDNDEYIKLKNSKVTIKEVEKIVEVPKIIYEDKIEYRNKYTMNRIIVLFLLLLVILAFLGVKIYYGSEYKLNANFEYNMRQYELDLNDWLEVNEELTLDLSKKEDKYLDYKEYCEIKSNICLDTTLENDKTKYDKAQDKYDIHQENKPIEPKKLV